MKAELVKTSKLSSGITLLTERVPRFQSLSIGVWVQAGSRHETPREAGLSHFLEHMMFKGTKNRSALRIAQEVDEAGGEFNAFTTREFTSFHLLLLAQDAPLAVDILSDVLLHSRFDKDEVRRESKVILQEIDMVNDSPEEVLYDEFFDRALGGHALGRPIQGTKATVRSFGRRDVVSYFQKHYSANQVTIAAAGDVDHAELKRMLERSLRGSRLSRHSRRLGNLATPRFRGGMTRVNKDTEQVQLLMGFPGLPIAHEERFVHGLLNIRLGGGMSSQLFQEIREKKGLAYSVYSSSSSFTDCGIMTLYAGTAPRDAAQCLTLMGKEARQLKEKRLTAKELSSLKRNLKNSILINEDSVEGHMMHLARSHMFFGRFLTLKEIFAAIDAVTAEQIQRLAARIFDAKSLHLACIGPRRDDLSSAALKRAAMKGLVD